MKQFAVGWRKAALVGVVWAFACQGDNHEDRDREECQAMVDHIFKVQTIGDQASDPERAAALAQHRASLRAAAEDRLMADCISRPRAHMQCVMQADTPAKIVACK